MSSAGQNRKCTLYFIYLFILQFHFYVNKMFKEDKEFSPHKIVYAVHNYQFSICERKFS